MIYPWPNSTIRDAACYEPVLEHTNDLISLLDPDSPGRYRYASPSYKRVLGYDPALLVGRSSTLLVHHEDLEIVQQQLASLTYQAEAQATLRYRHADGSWRWIETHWHGIRQRSGAYILVVGRDVTEERRLETRLHQIQKLNSIGRLAAGVAHDFHNVMSAIDAYAALALSALPLNSDVRADLEEIQRATARANSLTDQLLGFARRSTTLASVIDLNELIADLARLLRRLIGEDIELLIGRSADHPLVQADPGQIEQVLMNLAVNARDAMPFGGQLIIETRSALLDQAPERRVAQGGAGRYVVLTVSDTGIGMESQIQTKIFEPFFTTKPAGSGTGLGLAICDEIIQQHGGWISVQSEPGEGATFSIYLPQVVDQCAVPMRAAIEEGVDLPRGSETILVVEDDPSVRTFAARLLRRQGYTVLTASDGAEALRIACDHSQPIDLLLTDLVLPKLSGKIVAEQLRALWPDLSVIIMSGYPDAIVASYGSFETMRFLPKPCSHELLVSTVRTMLDSARVEAAATVER
jgi:two-component system cell cycle sensor histidine kinase/response regulator CckA